jgi:hypothetical protein
MGKNLAALCRKHWIGDPPLNFRGETLDGRRRLELVSSAPPAVVASTEWEAISELARRGHYERAYKLLSTTLHADCDAATLRTLTGLSKQACGRVLREGRTGTRAQRHTQRRRGARVAARLRALIERHEQDGYLITVDDLREALGPWGQP